MQRRTPAGRRFNKKMGGARVSVENGFAGLLNSWGAVGHKRMNKLSAMPLARHVHVAAMLYNIEGIFYGNQMTCMFGDHLREGMTVASYLSHAS
eukprot:1435931-Rhodomonas_salina.1